MIPPQWIEFGIIGSVRISTLLTAFGIFIYVFLRTKKLFIAAIAVMAWISLFEIIFVITDSIMHSVPWRGTFWIVAALAAYPILAYVQGIRPNYILILIFLSIWCLWIFMGFDYNSYNEPIFISMNEFMNVISKTTLAIAYALSKYITH
ncbi:MAG: hypothetical protein NWE86_03985 [Candidatus Bathyarchaeota archaeon]|nr:hypothetical protein [Candidatus Bathyarchaeota archaeon]